MRITFLFFFYSFLNHLDGYIETSHWMKEIDRNYSILRNGDIKKEQENKSQLVKKNLMK